MALKATENENDGAFSSAVASKASGAMVIPITAWLARPLYVHFYRYDIWRAIPSSFLLQTTPAKGDPTASARLARVMTSMNGIGTGRATATNITKMKHMTMEEKM